MRDEQKTNPTGRLRGGYVYIRFIRVDLFGFHRLSHVDI